MSRGFAVTTGARIPHPIPPSAWNPLDLITAQPLPSIVVLTEGNRVATRDSVLPDQWEGGVRGEQSRGGTPAERWYLELQVLSIGNKPLPNNNQGMQIGLIDDGTTNILSRPPNSDSSEATNSGSAGAYLLAYSRLDGVGFCSLPSPPTQVFTFGSQMAIGDVYGFDWLVGTSITVRRNNASPKVVAFAYTGILFPYFSAGATLVDATNQGSTESCRICTGRDQQLYTPVGATPWG